jgi:hypothetical protein
MFKRHTPTVDELLGDSLVQAVMRADGVEPQALRTLLEITAGRMAAARSENELRPIGALLANPPIERRLTPRVPMGPTRGRSVSQAGPCGSALCR